MIVEYQRPKTIQEALMLIAREHPLSFPLGGGTILNQGKDIDFAVIDLQELGLNTLKKKGKLIEIGATVTLQELLDFPDLPGNLQTTIEYEATYNLRQMATIAGTIASARGISPFVTSLLALDAGIEIMQVNEEAHQVKLGNWLPLRNQSKSEFLITSIQLPTNVLFRYEYIARTPADKPIICAALAQWESGRTRLALGGWGDLPLLAMDGPNSEGIEAAAKNALSIANDERASAEYRQAMAEVLAIRCLSQISSSR